MLDHGSGARSRSRVKLKRILRFVGLGAAVAGVGIQFVPVKEIGTNPSERFTLDAPPAVAAILRRACFDCHTNETRWPLYSRLAPGSWLMARDVHKGRTHLNFSEWSVADEEERADDLETCWEQVDSGEMPPWFYVFPMHPSARLSGSDKAQLKSYFLGSAKTPRSDRPTHVSEEK